VRSDKGPVSAAGAAASCEQADKAAATTKAARQRMGPVGAVIAFSLKARFRRAGYSGLTSMGNTLSVSPKE
jgi:hypothetical protein